MTAWHGIQKYGMSCQNMTGPPEPGPAQPKCLEIWEHGILRPEIQNIGLPQKKISKSKSVVSKTLARPGLVNKKTLHILTLFHEISNNSFHGPENVFTSLFSLVGQRPLVSRLALLNPVCVWGVSPKHWPSPAQASGNLATWTYEEGNPK